MIYVDTKYIKKEICKDIQQRHIKDNTENATQYACKLVLPSVDLGTSLVRNDFVKIKSSSLLGSLLGFDFCFAISESKRRQESLKEHVTFQL